MRLLTRSSAAAAAAALVLTGGLVLPAAANAAPPLDIGDQPITLDSGHIDAFNVVLAEDDSPLLVLKEDVTGSHVMRTPESVELFVKPGTLRATSAWAFPAGLPVPFYLLPYNQNQNFIWPGWDTNSLKPVYGNDVNTGIEVSAVEGPGEIWLWQQTDEGAASSLDGGGFTLPATIRQAFPSHTHTAWGFTAPGTYKLTVQAHVSGNGLTASSNTAVYTFVVGERTQLSPTAPTQNGNTVTIPSQQWVSYVDADGAPIAAGELELTEDLEVRAVPAFGFDLAADAAASWSFEHEAPAPEQTIEITGVGHHYHQGRPISLEIVADPAQPGASYEWFMQRKDQAAPVRIAGESGATLSLTAEQAFDDARITANLLDGSGAVLASASAVVIDVNDHGAAPHQAVTIEGLSDHYHSGTVANLTASVAPASALTRFEWLVQREGESDWTAAAGEHGPAYSFTVTEELDGALVRARLTFDDGTEYVQSEPVEIVVDDHHGETPVETELSISGLASGYVVGATASLTAVQSPQTEEDHYHWFIKRAGADGYTVIPGALSDRLEYTVLAEDADAEVIVRLYDHDHGVIAESDPVVLKVERQQEPGEQKPGDAPAEPEESALDEVPASGIELDRSTAKQGEVVVAQIGEGAVHSGEWVAAWLLSEPVLLGGDWQQVSANGTLALRVPADATPGAHRIAVFDASNSLIGWQSLRVLAADTGSGGGGDTGALENTGSAIPAFAIGASALLLLGGSAALIAARRRRAANEG